MFSIRTAANKPDAAGWERALIERLASASITEQRRARRWGILFKALTFIYLFMLFGLLFGEDVSDVFKRRGTHSALVEVHGLIAPDTQAAADKIIKGLRAAFADSGTKGVILRINSPGGSPVQAGYVYDEIRRLRGKYPAIPLYAVIADIGASGAYYMAAAADAIYADKASLVGSIGVLMNGFGFVDTMKTLGVERRLLTAGEHKGVLDPFSPIKPEDEAFIKGLLEQLHHQFIDAVKVGRKGKLKEDPSLFSGLFWSGEQAVNLGLVDGLGSSGSIARDIIHADNIIDYTSKDDWLKHVAENVGDSAGEALATLLGFSNALRLR